MPPDPTPALTSQAQALGAASNDADANAGSGNVGEPVSSCHGAGPAPTPLPTPVPTPRPTPTPTPTPTPVPMSSLWVRLELTQEDAANEPGSLRLQGTVRGYNKTIAIAGNFVANPAPDNTVDVIFDKVPTTASYTLTYIGGDGTETTIVQSTPFSRLQDDSLPPAPAPTPGP